MNEETQIDSELILNANHIRKNAIKDYINNYPSFETIKRTPKSVFNYYYFGKLACSVFLEALETFHGDQNIWINLDDEEEDEMIPGRLVINDLNKVVFPLAISAWLTIDSWRAHEYFNDENIPSDLSYGLVLEYPIPIIRMSMQMLEPFANLTMTLDEEDREEAKEKAIEEVMKDFKYSRKACLKLIPDRVELEL